MFASGGEFGFRMLGNETYDFDFVLSPSFDELDPHDSPQLAGMEKRDMTAEAGVKFSYRVRKVGASLHFATDILGKHDGHRLGLELNRPFNRGKWMIIPALSATWLSEDLVDYYYGVRPHEVTEFRPAYTGDSTVNLGADLFVVRPVKNKWAVMGGLFLEIYGDGITDSPIIDQDSSLGGFAGVGYSF